MRNEVNIRQFTPEESKELYVTFTDERRTKGENRYYVRVEQEDKNVAWSSPIWVTYR